MSEAVGRHVFICGYSRSGSTMFYNMLRTTVTNLRFMERERPARLVIGASTENFVTKRPLDIFDIDHIVAANVFRKQIHCLILIRDIRAIVTSRHKSVPDDYFIGFDRQYFIQGGAATYTNPGILQTHAAIERAQRRRDMRIAVVRYEDILRHPDAVQSRLGRDIGFLRRLFLLEQGIALQHLLELLLELLRRQLQQPDRLQQLGRQIDALREIRAYPRLHRCSPFSILLIPEAIVKAA